MVQWFDDKSYEVENDAVAGAKPDNWRDLGEETPEEITLETLKLLPEQDRRRFALVMSAVAALGMDVETVMQRLVDEPIRESSLEAQVRRDTLRGMEDGGWTRPTATLGEHIASWAIGVGKRIERHRG